MVWLLILGGMVFLSGLYIFSSKREHLLSVLLSLEYMSLGVFIFFMVMMWGGDYFYSLIYLIYTACEGALGLSILVVMSRACGGDYFVMLNLYN